MPFRRNSIVLTVLAVISSVTLSSCGEKKEESKPEEQLPTVPVVKVQRLRLQHELNLPGELLAYQDVPVHAKVEGFIQWIGVDRGSIVRKGQKMITIFCPELVEKTKESVAKESAAEASYRQAQSALQTEISRQLEAKAKLDADRLTYERLKLAAKTPGAVAQNEVDIASKTVEADIARVESEQAAIDAAKALVAAQKQNFIAAKNVVSSLKDMESYLTVCAPFDGVITERNVHTGSIVSVDALRNALPLVRIQEKDILRLVVAVPEDSVSGITLGQKFKFTVPAFIGRTFEGVVARPAYALNNSTRTMPVELNVFNYDGTLEPGMFATVSWEVTRPNDTLFVPNPAVDTDLAGTYSIRVNNNVTQRVNVTRGLSMGNLIEVNGDLHEGELVALKATNELKTGTKVKYKMADEAEINSACKHTSAGGE